MKKFAIVCIAAVGAAMLLLGTAPAASAYPDLSCNVTVDHQTVSPGESFTATGQSTASANWTFRWNGVTKTRTGTVVHASFTAPHVTRSRKITLTARASSANLTCVHHLTITVTAATVSAPSASSGAGGSGGLPNTGGPAFWILVAALALLVGGGSAVAVARRRS